MAYSFVSGFFDDLVKLIGVYKKVPEIVNSILKLFRDLAGVFVWQYSCEEAKCVVSKYFLCGR